MNTQVPTVHIVSSDEAIASGLSPWNVLSIVKFHRNEIEEAIKAKKQPSAYNIAAIPLIQELARQMFVKLREAGHVFHFPKKTTPYRPRTNSHNHQPNGGKHGRKRPKKPQRQGRET